MCGRTPAPGNRRRCSRSSRRRCSGCAYSDRGRTAARTAWPSPAATPAPPPVRRRRCGPRRPPPAPPSGTGWCRGRRPGRPRCRRSTCPRRVRSAGRPVIGRRPASRGSPRRAAAGRQRGGGSGRATRRRSTAPVQGRSRRHRRSPLLVGRPRVRPCRHWSRGRERSRSCAESAAPGFAQPPRPPAPRGPRRGAPAWTRAIRRPGARPCLLPRAGRLPAWWRGPRRRRAPAGRRPCRGSAGSSRC